MKKLKETRKIYDSIEIPEELQGRVLDSIQKFKEEERSRNQSDDHIISKWKRRLYAVSISGVVVLGCLIITLNTSETFAKAASNVMILGKIAKVLTIRTYEEQDDIMNISVKVPEIVEDSENFDNEEISAIVDSYIEDAKARMRADKEVFLATGGTEEEWLKRDLQINADYTVTYQEGNIVSLIILLDESWYSAYDVKYFYNMDFNEKKELTLEDVLGDDYVDIANENILSQMKERVAMDSNLVYWGITDLLESSSGITGFKTVDKETKFYLNEDGNAVVYFDKYEIAPGFMGAQEFIISKIE